MVSQQDLADVRSMMVDFADRTGLLASGKVPIRYLWTDAFAVCGFLSLFDELREDEYLSLAIRLIDQVHETLGRHRPDDARSGWVSGLDAEAGRRHPTAGGLRIGKRSGEGEDWDSDGQYFHYLTQWMHALERVAVITSDATYCRWAIELAQAAHAGFTYLPAHGGNRRMYWKMSIDLSRPLVLSMGQHDPLNAFVTYAELEHCRTAHFADAGLPDLQGQMVDAAAICSGMNWVSEDPLGIGGLLIDLYRMSQLQIRGIVSSATALEKLLTDAHIGLLAFLNGYTLRASAAHRLAFRELGLAIGLHAVDALRRRRIDRHIVLSDDAAVALARFDPFLPAARQIETFWGSPTNQSVATWRDHLDINSVMLATSILPEQLLSV